MVADTEKLSEGSHFSSRRDKVDLPAPEGDERMTSSPRRFDSCIIYLSFHVLDLLTHLVDDRFQRQPGLCQPCIPGL